MRPHVLVGGLLVLAAGCVTTKAAVLNPGLQLAPVCPEGVMVFTSPDRVGQSYTEVALLDSKGDTDLTSEAGMIESQRRKAGELGANGVILGTVEDATTGQKVAQAILGTSANRKGKAIAIHIPGDSVRVRDACPPRSGP